MAVTSNITPTGAETDPETVPVKRHRSWGAAFAVVGTALGFAAFTALVFLVRAGDEMANNWPLRWELGYVDNSVLFAFARDVFTGAPMDWHFSPQVYLFPEIPISLLAYALAGGALKTYYIIAAMLNNALLYCVLLWAIRALWPNRSWATTISHAATAALPLLLLPWLAPVEHVALLFHLGPNYYIGIYLAAFCVPVALGATSKTARIAAVVGYTMTAACDPLLVALTGPALALLILKVWREAGWAAVRQTLSWAAGSVIVAATVYVAVFRATGLAANSITDGYMFSLRRAGGTLGNLGYSLLQLLQTMPVLAGAQLASWVLVGWLGRRCWKSLDTRALPADQSRLYLALLPWTGLAAMLLILAAHFWYSWLLLVGSPIVALLLRLSEKVFKPTALVTYGLLALTLTVQLAVRDEPSPYFNYTDPVAPCLDQRLPPGPAYCTGTNGCRALGVQAGADWSLIQLAYPSLGASSWLENLAPARDTQPIHNLVIVPDEWSLQEVEPLILTRFGPADRVYNCPTTTAEIWTYDSDLKPMVNR